MLAAPALARPVSAQSWPNGPVRLVVPVPPGGSIDAVARLGAPALSAELGVPVVIENRSGGAGSIGTGVVAKAPADGNTWLITFDWHPMMNALVPNLSFDTRTDFTPAFLVGSAPYVLAARPDAPFRSLAEVIAAAKARPETVTFASTGSGTLGHLVMVLLGARAGVRMVHVAYRGGGPAMTDTLGGRVDLMIGSAALMAPAIADGRLRAITQTGAERIPALTSLPTAAEDGYRDVVASAWWGYFGPAGVPAPIVSRFAGALRAAYSGDRVRATMTETQQARLILGDAAALTELVEREAGLWSRVIREHEIKAD
jgi:tripartite-type tricarboxylate transporter receptor subunit TctC